MYEDDEEEALGGLAGALPWTTPTRSPPHDHRREASWTKFQAMTRAQPLPEISPWLRLKATLTSQLEDMLAVLLVRGGAPVWQHAVAAGVTKGEAPAPVHGDITLSPAQPGDRVHLTLVLPREGSVVVLWRDVDGITCLYPRQPHQLGPLPEGGRIPLAGVIQGHTGDQHDIVVGLCPGPLPAEILTSNGDALLRVLGQVEGLRLRHYHLPLTG